MDDDPFSDENFFGKNPKLVPVSKKKAEELGPVVRGLAYIGEQGMHALPDAIGFVGDILRTGTKLRRGIGLSEEDIPSMGPVTKAVNKQLKPDKFTPTNSFEEFLGTGSRMAMGGLIGGGPKAAGLGVASGISSAVGGEGARRIFPDSKYAPVIGSLLGAFGPAAGVVARNVNTARNIRAGSAHPNFPMMVQIVKELEGGGTFANPKTNPTSGAMGPMQVMPATAKDPGHGIRPWDGKSQADLARVGTQKLAVLIKKFDGDVDKALASYNWGEGNVMKALKKHGDNWLAHAPEETRNYVANGLKKAGMEAEQAAPVAAPVEMAAAPSDTPPPMSEVPPERRAALQDIIDQADGSKTPDAEQAVAPPEAPASNVSNQASRFTNADKEVDGLHTMVEDMHQKITQEGHVVDPAELGKTRAMVQNEMDGLDPASHNYAVLRDADEMLSRSIAHSGGNPEPFPRQATDPYMGQEPVVAQTANDNVDQAALTNQLYEHLTGQKAPANLSPEEMVGAVRESFKDNGPRSKIEIDTPFTPKGAANNNKLGLVDNETLPPGGEGPPIPPRGPDDPTGGEPPPRGPDEPSGPEGRPGLFERLKQRLVEAGEGLKTQGGERTTENARRLAMIDRARKMPKGDAREAAMRSARKGEMPGQDFASIREHFSPEEIRSLKDHLIDHPSLHGHEPLNAADGLESMLDGKLPQDNQLKLLYRALPRDLMVELIKHRKMGFEERAMDIANISRGLMTAADISGAGRQGVFFIGSKAYWTSLDDMFKGGWSEVKAREIDASITSDPMFAEWQDAGGFHATRDGLMDGTEETFNSTTLHKIPIAGKVVDMSERAYVTYLNKLRFDHFKAILGKFEAAGKPITSQTKTTLAEMINIGTGRGDLGILEKLGNLLSFGLFSPKLIASRIQLANPFWYLKLYRQDRNVGKEAMKSALTYAGIMGSFLGLVAAAGVATVETDLRSTDAYKIKMGNVRLDPTGGMTPWVRLLVQVGTQTKKAGDGSLVPFSDKPFAPNNMKQLGTFLRSKESPAFSFIHDWFSGKDFLGRPTTVARSVLSRSFPMILGDMAEGILELGAKGAFLGIPSGIGWGVSVYDSEAKRQDPKDDPTTLRNIGKSLGVSKGTREKSEEADPAVDDDPFSDENFFGKQ